MVHVILSMKNWILLTLFFLSIAATFQAQSKKQTKKDSEKTFTIAFGSCSDQNRPQILWKSVLENKPDVWIWLGDNIYADTSDMKLMEEMYQKQKNHPDYQELIQKTKVYGVWDDHDYGVNDGGKHWPFKQQAKHQLLKFLDYSVKLLPSKEGMYHAVDLSFHRKKIKLIFLDTRWFRDTLYAAPENSEQRYIPNPEGEILGEIQWKWLDKQLDGKFDYVILASSIQVLQTSQGYEKWANFPKEYERMKKLLETKKLGNRCLIISGDRHIAELMKEKIPSGEIFEFTSSGLTHTWSSNMKNEENSLRISPLVRELNFGVIKLISLKNSFEVEVIAKGENNRTIFSQKIFPIVSRN